MPNQPDGNMAHTLPHLGLEKVRKEIFVSLGHSTVMVIKTLGAITRSWEVFNEEGKKT